MKDRSKKLLVINTGKKGDQEGVYSASAKPSVAGGSGMASPGNLSDYLLKSIWDRVWEIKTDSKGNEYIFGKLPVVTQYGITMYADGGELNLPSIYAGIPFDNKTIWLNPETKKVEVIGGTGGGVADSVHWNNIEGKPLFSAVATSGKYADLSGLPDLSVYATTEYLTAELKKYVTIDGNEAINGLKNFTKGLQIDGLGITKSQDDVIYIDANLVVRGGITMFGTNSVDVPTIMDAIATDNVNLKVVDGVLTFVGSSGGELTEVHWDDVIGRPTLLSSFIDDVVSGHYLPLSGGKVTGQIEYNFDWGGNIPAAGAISFGSIDELPLLKSFIGNGLNTTYNKWVDIISVRADNGSSQFGMYLVTSMTDPMDSLSWNRQAYGTWQGERIILDSHNWPQYVTAGDGGNYLPLTGGTVSGNVTIQQVEIGRTNEINGTGYYLYLNYSHDSLLIMGCNSKPVVVDPKWATNQGNTQIRDLVDTTTFAVVAPIHGLAYYKSANSAAFIFDKPGSYQTGIGANGESDTIYFGACDRWGAWHSYGQIWKFGGSIVSGALKIHDSNVIDATYGSGVHLNYYGTSDVTFCKGGGTTIAYGNLLTHGGITMYSDIRKKTKLQDVELTLQQIADAPLIEHYYNSDTNKTTHVGSIAQYWASMNDWFCKLDNNGYYTMEIQNAALASAISIARELVKYESKTDKAIKKLKKRICELEEEVERLKAN